LNLFASPSGDQRQTIRPAEQRLVVDGRVRIRFVSESMMFHPMHLHGHTFQVVQRNGAGARKDTVLVSPMATVEVDFDTDNPGRWIIHCHNDYHLNSGMVTFVYCTG
jgi:FtsP/CotA-like multicopper oxidase with cupredoxin domain